jgi:hypothetical protein
MRTIPTIPAGFINLQGPPAGDELDDQHDQSDHEQQVNESTQRIGADQTQ